MLVYIETTVWSFALAEDSPELTTATIEFFRECREGRFTTMIGPTVVEELAGADSPLREQLLDLVREIGPRILARSLEAQRLGEAFLRVGAVPPSKPQDALHVAYAFVGEADAIVSWNFKHIANVRRAQKFNAAAILHGVMKPLIITSPHEVLYGDA